MNSVRCFRQGILLHTQIIFIIKQGHIQQKTAIENDILVFRWGKKSLKINILKYVVQCKSQQYSNNLQAVLQKG